MEGNTGHYGSRKRFVGLAEGERNDLWVGGEVASMAVVDLEMIT